MSEYVKAMINPDTIAEWKRVIAAATPGPWIVSVWAVYSKTHRSAIPKKICEWPAYPGQYEGDKKFVALARTAFPKLLEAYEALQAILARAKELGCLDELHLVLEAGKRAAEARVRGLEAEVKWLRGDTGGIRWERPQP